MNKEDKERIISWLRGSREWEEGVAIYRKVGCNIRLKREFAFGETEMLREILTDQLMSLAEMDELALKRMDIKPPVQVPAYAPAPEPVKEILRFRERYPFLKSADCPAVLKAMVTDMFTAYETYKSAHEKLADLPAEEREKAFVLCREVVEKFLENRRVWEALDFYKEHGSLPEDIEEPAEITIRDEISALTDLELASKFKSAVANESKHRKTVKSLAEKGEPGEKAESQLQYWSHRKKALQEEIERRKKNS